MLSFFPLNYLLLLNVIITIILKITSSPLLLIKIWLEDVALGLLAKGASNSEVRNLTFSPQSPTVLPLNALPWPQVSIRITRGACRNMGCWAQPESFRLSRCEMKTSDLHPQVLQTLLAWRSHLENRWVMSQRSVELRAFCGEPCSQDRTCRAEQFGKLLPKFPSPIWCE